MTSKPRSNRRRIGWFVLALVVVWGAGLVPAAIQARDIRAAASAAQDKAAQAISSLRAGDFDLALQRLDEATAALDDAGQELDSNSLIVARLTPLLGSELRATRKLVQAAEDASVALAELARELRPVLDPKNSKLMPEKGRVNLALIPSMRASILDAFPAVDQATQDASNAAGNLRLGITSGPATRMLADLVRVRDSLADSSELLTVLPGLLGEDGPKTHLIVLQNLAESRGTGGLIGGYAVVRTDRGRIEVRTVASNQKLKLPPSAKEVAMPDWFAQRYDRYGVRRHWSNVNMHPDAPVTSNLIAKLYRYTTGTSVDSVILMDPFTMQELVKSTGSVTADGVTFKPDTTARNIMIDSYERSGFNTDPELLTARKDAMVDVAEKIIPRLLDPANVFSVGSALAQASASNHLAMWSTDKQELEVLNRLGLAGSFIPKPDETWIGVSFNNGAANKMDAYLQNTLNLATSHQNGVATVTGTLTMRFDSPTAGALPQIVAGPIPDTEGAAPGKGFMLTAIYLPPEAEVAPQKGMRTSKIPGATVIDTVIEVTPDQPGSVTFTFRLATESLPDSIPVHQIPAVNPLVVTAS